MAGEIRVGGNIQWNRPNSTNSIKRSFSAKSIDQAGTNMVTATQEIGFAAEEALPVTDIGALGFAFFFNHEATGGNYVEVGDDTGAFVPFLRLLPQEFAGPIRLSDSMTALSAQANTAAVDLEFWIFEA